MKASFTKLRKGFTLVELLIVIIIIAVLAAIAIPKFANSSQRSKEAALKSDLKIVRNAIDLFRSDTGFYPKQLSDLATATAPAQGYDASGTLGTVTAANFKGPYADQIPTDPVSGSALSYSVTSPNVGVVTASATGNASDGTAFSSW